MLMVVLLAFSVMIRSLLGKNIDTERTKLILIRFFPWFSSPKLRELNVRIAHTFLEKNFFSWINFYLMDLKYFYGSVRACSTNEEKLISMASINNVFHYSWRYISLLEKGIVFFSASWKTFPVFLYNIENIFVSEI